MNYIAFVEMNVFALIILFLLLINIHQKLHGYSYEQNLLLALIIFNVVQICLDSAAYLIYTASVPIPREINIAVHAVYYGLTPVPCILWYLYAHYQVYLDKVRSKIIWTVLLVPLFLNTVLSVLSCFYDCSFYIDAQNHYYRGKYFYIVFLICIFYLSYTQIFIFLKRHVITRNYYIPIFTFAIPPFLGGILQTLFDGLPLVWIGMTISVLIVSINIQNDQMYSDPLTGLYNRRLLRSYLENYKRKDHRGRLAGVMIDMDSFKSINDVWGHATGDEALKYTGEILKESLKRTDFICRYGGDEFVALFKINNMTDLYEMIYSIRQNLKLFNKNHTLPYQIGLSMGYDILEPCETADRFLRRIDDLMYNDKRANKIKIEKA